MLFSIFKRISYPLIIILLIFPVFFFQTNIALAQQRGNLFDEESISNITQKFTSFFSSQHQPANVFTGFINTLSKGVYCGISSIFVNNCDINATNNVQSNSSTIQNNMQIITNRNQNRDIFNTTNATSTIIEGVIGRVINPVGNTILTGIIESYIDNKLVQLATQLRQELFNTITTTTGPQGPKGDRGPSGRGGSGRDGKTVLMDKMLFLQLDLSVIYFNQQVQLQNGLQPQHLALFHHNG